MRLVGGIKSSELYTYYLILVVVCVVKVEVLLNYVSILTSLSSSISTCSSDTCALLLLLLMYGSNSGKHIVFVIDRST